MIPRLVPVLAAVLLLAPSGARAAAPWEGAPFSASPRALLDAAAALPPAPPGADIDVLLEDGTLALDARGAGVFTQRLVYRIVSEAGARAWGEVQRGWAPWHQARPEVEARVVTPDGEVHRLDPATLAEREAGGAAPTTRRVLAGRLPDVGVGAIVEERAVVRDREPAFAAGGSTRIFLGQPAPVRALRFTIEAAEALPLHVAVAGGAPKPRETVRHGVRRVSIERRDVPASAHPEPLAPRDVPAGPTAVIGWARSWADVAAGYAALCDRALGDQDLSALARAALGGPPPGGRDAAVRAVAAFLRDGVRATGRALGEADLAPVAPAETFVRRTGDAKDLALLAVALLRGLGVPADPALVRGSWNELDPAVPGVGAFEHVLVRVRGTPEVWLDPSDASAVPGRLPPPFEGRLALVAAPGTTGLVRTPEAPPEVNRIRTLRELRLAPLGRGSIAETRELDGALAGPERAIFGAADAAGRRALGERYAKEVFGSDELAAFEIEGEDDPARPLRIRLEAREAEVLRTGDDEAEVPVTPDQVFGALPPPLAPGEGAPAPRAADAVLELPYVWEIVYRIVPPDGFRPRALPAPTTEAFGPARYTASYAVEPDRAVVARFRFDTGGRRLPAADADRLARRVREVAASRGPTVTLERIAAALLAEGKVAEAVAELRRLEAAHPAEALHHLHHALALLSLGFADAAADEARRAVALEPERAWCHRVLGFALEHDDAGRLHGPGFDRAGALAAYREAVRLDPDVAAGRAALAELLAYAPDGARHGKGARLDDAIAEYRVVREDLGEKDYAIGQLAALVAAGRVADAEALARDTPRGPERDAALVAAVADQRGADAGIAEAVALGASRPHALQAAARILLRARRYRAVSALAAAAGADPDEARKLAAPFEHVRRWEELVREGDEGVRLVRRLFVASATAKDAAAAVKDLAARDALHAELRKAALAAAAGVASGAGASAREQGVPLDVLVDVVLSGLEIAQDGDDAGGLRLRLRFAKDAPESAVWAVRERGALRFVGTSGAWPLAADRALRLAESGDVAGALRWLGWARDAAPGEKADSASPAGIAAALLPADGPPDLAQVRLAAAALVAFADERGRTVPMLERARAAAATPPARRALGFALAQALRAAGKPARVLPLARALREEQPSRTAFALEVFAAEKLRSPEAVDALEAAVRASLPDDGDALALVPNARLVLGDLAGARRGFRAIVDGGKATPMLLNNAAWLELWFDPPSAETLDWARGANPEGSRAHASQNTLAAVLASTGHPAEAREVFRRSLAANGDVEPIPADWFVVGRIAEALGLPDVARAAYAKVKPEPEDPTAPYLLARRRLAALGPAHAAAPVPTPPARKPVPERTPPPRKRPRPPPQQPHPTRTVPV